MLNFLFLGSTHLTLPQWLVRRFAIAAQHRRRLDRYPVLGAVQ
jgi:hypothetical protein